ncbi:hypothetical protein BKA82DRAFT_4358426 [Pisolithus tinctorius]|nr:hypothetical protein BKA82DRAFT_4358426 [Pisolithus tinctorius]
MPKLTNNPHLAVQPDFTSEKYHQAQECLVNDDVNHDAAAAQLALYWALNNDLEKEEWDHQVLQEQQEATEKERLEEEEQEMQQTKACCLLKDNDALTLLQTGDGLHSFVPLALAWAKGTITRDEDLTWEEFSEAAHGLANAMKENNWEADNISNHVKFWLALENHPWRHGHCEISKRALLVYQARVCRRWHDMLDTEQSFNIVHINNVLLVWIRDKLVHSAQVVELESLKQVSPPPHFYNSAKSNTTNNCSLLPLTPPPSLLSSPL